MWTNLELAGFAITGLGLVLQAIWRVSRFPARIANSVCSIGVMLLGLSMAEQERAFSVVVGRVLVLSGSALLLYSVLRPRSSLGAQAAPPQTVLATTELSTDPTVVRSEVAEALVEYKAALVTAHYRNWWHRFACRCGDREALQADKALQGAEAWARAVARRSGLHGDAVRRIAGEQPAHVREQDRFLDLLKD